MGTTNKVIFNDENYKNLLDDISKLQESCGKNIDDIVKNIDDLVGDKGDLNVEKVSQNVQLIASHLKWIKSDAVAYFGTLDKILSEYMASIARIDQLK